MTRGGSFPDWAWIVVVDDDDEGGKKQQHWHRIEIEMMVSEVEQRREEQEHDE